MRKSLSAKVGKFERLETTEYANPQRMEAAHNACIL